MKTTASTMQTGNISNQTKKQNFEQKVRYFKKKKSAYIYFFLCIIISKHIDIF